jgi:hypothetical protein
MITNDELKTAILKVDLLLKSRQAWWKPWKTIAMVLLAVAAIVATSGAVSHFWPPQPQSINVHFDQPIAIKLVQ